MEEKLKIVNDDKDSYANSLGVDEEKMKEIIKQFAPKFSAMVAKGVGKTGMMIDMAKLAVLCDSCVDTKAEFATLMIFAVGHLEELRADEGFIRLAKLMGDETIDAAADNGNFKVV